MCGIVGLKVSRGSFEENSKLIDNMLGQIVHRGPDHSGKFVSNNIALGNQRLKIIDLEGGNQPIFNENGSVVVVYNGEIYNFPELRELLVKKGHLFKTKSDTEVLVHLYEEYGQEFVKMLNGIFAFALYDIRSDILLLARDRFGVKPLFFMERREGVYFASEINALRVVPDFNGDLDYEAISIYLSQFYIPQPWSVHRHVKRLKAGHYMVITSSGKEYRCYYDVDFSKKERMSAGEAEEEIVRLLGLSVRRQLMSDVPIGSFLSSGLDSCALLAMATKEGGRMSSFSLSFSDPLYDENDIAAERASFFRSEHHRVLMEEDTFLALLEKRLTHSGEPLGLWINVGEEYLSRYASEHGFKVVLSGAGGDEFFCGYPTLNAAILSRAYSIVPQVVRHGLIEKCINRLPAGSGSLPYTFMLKSFVNALDESLVRTFYNFKRVISPSDFKAYLTSDAYARINEYSPYIAFEQYSEKIKDYDLIDALQYIDIKVFLEGCVLHLSDNASMAASLEERVPLLDNDLVDFACKIPVELKFNLFKVKPLLHNSLSRYLKDLNGAHLIKDYKKRGFELPGNKWIKEGRLKEYLKNRLSTEAVSKLNFFRPEAVEAALNNHLNSKQNNERLLQCILGMTHFLEKYT